MTQDGRRKDGGRRKRLRRHEWTGTPAQVTRLAADLPGAWYCVLQERDGRRCWAREYKRKEARRTICQFLGVRIPKAQLEIAAP